MRDNKTTRRMFLLGGAAICTLSSNIAFGGLQDELEFFDGSAFERFNGNEWNGLTLNTTTTADIKKQYRTSKGAARPEAMVLPQDRSSKVNVQTLTDGRGGVEVAGLQMRVGGGTGGAGRVGLQHGHRVALPLRGVDKHAP